MTFEALSRYHEKLIEVFNAVPRQRKDLALWNKSAVIARMNRTFQTFLVEEATRLATALDTPPQHTDSDYTEPIPKTTSEQLPVEEVFIPEWKPQLEQPESEGDEYD